LRKDVNKNIALWEQIV